MKKHMTPVRPARVRPAPRPPGHRGRWTRPALTATPLVCCVLLALVLYQGRSSSGLFVWEIAATYVLFAAGTKFVFAVAGVFTFGQAAAFGTGAYTVALLGRIPVSGLQAVLLAGCAAALVCLAVSTAMLRTTGIGFAMVTLASGQVLNQLTYKVHTFGGENGLPGIVPGRLFGLDLTLQRHLWWYVFLVVGVCLALLAALERSQFGATLRGLRDNPVLAEATGVPVVRARMTAFAVAGFFGGVAGGLLAQVQLSVTPDLLDFSVSGTVIVMCLLGGTPWFVGAPLGAVIYIWGQQRLADGGQNVLLWTGLAFLAVVLFAPDGLTGLAVQGARGAGARRDRRGRPRQPRDDAEGDPS
ncbi:branched-chain amino acid ABC transporter permease [Actinacidiphila sp. ITFR-21]|uniref:branched-chain amino acid ABC transporter permease n=1 Tax=Actinacidiphila sp. ITFR-21 TaxID=3075199 RepID=UPI00288BF0D6|nr:branched-chain amino acid ABC transporter permease [Streptomyces sp. ITFR-21]WNI19003.1 branched-chain amino acid ABC transporter permease [Streptomyces sp. ITFR-21]